MVDTNAPDKKRSVCAIVVGDLKQARMRGGLHVMGKRLKHHSGKR